MFDDFTRMNTDAIKMDAEKYLSYGWGKERKNKKQLEEMKRKEISKRRKRRFLFNRS
jgi:hypothetical protein